VTIARTPLFVEAGWTTDNHNFWKKEIEIFLRAELDKGHRIGSSAEIDICAQLSSRASRSFPRRHSMQIAPSSASDLA
jgi:hypothetical protein